MAIPHLTVVATGTLFTSYDNASTYNGNVTVDRTDAGTSEIFRVGAVAVTGNFSYNNNNAGGNTRINQYGAAKVPITGTVNITATGVGNRNLSYGTGYKIILRVAPYLFKTAGLLL